VEWALEASGDVLLLQSRPETVWSRRARPGRQLYRGPGSGFYHSDKVWLENLGIPLGFLRTYIAKSSAARRSSGRWRPSSPNATGSWPSTPT